MPRGPRVRLKSHLFSASTAGFSAQSQSLWPSCRNMRVNQMGVHWLLAQGVLSSTRSSFDHVFQLFICVSGCVCVGGGSTQASARTRIMLCLQGLHLQVTWAWVGSTAQSSNVDKPCRLIGGGRQRLAHRQRPVPGRSVGQTRL